MNTRRPVLALVSAIIAAHTLHPASAAPAEGKAVIQTPPKESLWEVVIEPYGWLTGVKGSTGVAGQTLNMDVPFDEIIDNVDYGAYLSGEVRRGRWAVLFDGYIAQLSGVGDPPGSRFVSVDGTLKQGYLDIDIAYRLAEGRRGFVDAYVGCRYNYISAEITTTVVPSVGAFPVAVSTTTASKQWADPLIGIRGQYDFNEKWFARGRLDVGGFNIVSNVTFQGNFSVGYNFSRRIFAEVGYRYLLTDYQSGGFTYNLATSGLWTGVGIRF